MDLDTFSKSDPVCHVYMRIPPAQTYTLVGKTEIIQNSLNPDFAKSFRLEYFFEKEQHMRFELYDDDESKLEHIGNVETTLGRIVGAQRQTFLEDLKIPGKNVPRGKLILRADSLKESNNEVEMKFSASGLPDKATCLCGSNDPFCVISRKIHQQEWVKVHVTDTIRGKTSPSFNRLKLPLAQLCNADVEAPLKFELYSDRENGSHVYYGEFLTCVAELQGGQRSF